MEVYPFYHAGMEFEQRERRKRSGDVLTNEGVRVTAMASRRSWGTKISGLTPLDSSGAVGNWWSVLVPSPRLCGERVRVKGFYWFPANEVFFESLDGLASGSGKANHCRMSQT